MFNNNQVNITPYLKQLGMILDDKLKFTEHLKYIANKVNNFIRLSPKLQKLLPRRSIVTINKSFIIPHLGYEDVIFNKAYNKSLYKNLEPFSTMLR